MQGCWFVPRLLLAECRGVPEQDASPWLLLTSWLSPCVVDSAVGVWICAWMSVNTTLLALYKWGQFTIYINNYTHKCISNTCTDQMIVGNREYSARGKHYMCPCHYLKFHLNPWPSAWCHLLFVGRLLVSCLIVGLLMVQATTTFYIMLTRTHCFGLVLYWSTGDV